MKQILTLVFALSTALVSYGREKPNVLFIAIDDLRPDLGCYGNAEVKSPHMDKLASEGMVFQNAYCQMALCGPSRNSIMTGMYPDGIGIWGMSKENPIEWREGREYITSLPQQFRKHGYQAVGMGKIYDYRNGIDKEHSWDRFERVGTKYGRPKKGRPAFQSIDAADGMFPDGAVTQKAIQTLKDADTNKQPLFLAVGFQKPHLPFTTPKKYWDLYDRDKLTHTRRTTPPVGRSEYLISPYKEIFSYDVPNPIPLEMERELLHGYYACVSFVDAQIGKLVAALKAEGIYDNTLIIIWGDHGFKLGDHGEWAKDTNLELDARVPLIFKTPKAIAGSHGTQAIVELVDVMPTMLEIAGLPIPETVEGVSLVPVLENSKAEVRKFALTQDKGINGTMGYSIRTLHYRYNEWRKKKGGKIVARELYDFRGDRMEMKNIIDEKPEIAVKLAKALDTYLKNANTYKKQS